MYKYKHGEKNKILFPGKCYLCNYLYFLVLNKLYQSKSKIAKIILWLFYIKALVSY